MRVVKVAEVGRIKRGTREKSRGKGKESLGSIADERGVGMAMTADKISAVASCFDNNVRSTSAIREFSDSASGGIGLDLHYSHDKVTNSKGDGGTGIINTLAVSSAALFGEEAKHLLRELRRGASKAEESMNVGCLIGGRGWGFAEADIKGKPEGSANGGNAANDVSTVNRAAVPGISSCVSSFHKHSVSATVIGGNSDGFIQKPVKVFNADGFVIPFSGTMKGNVEEETHFLEETLKSAAVVHNDNTAKSDFEEYILDK
jgi:hypothetical protein